MTTRYDEERLMRLEGNAERALRLGSDALEIARNNAKTLEQMIALVVGPELPGGDRDTTKGLLYATRSVELSKRQTGGAIAVGGAILADVILRLGEATGWF